MRLIIIQQECLFLVDGDYPCQGVTADWETYEHYLRQGSIIIVHDSGWAEGVMQVINEDLKHIVEDVESLPNMWWGTILNNL